MSRYNKAIAGGAGAAVALIIAWIAGEFGIEVPKEVEGAFVILLSALGPFFGPANK